MKEALWKSEAMPTIFLVPKSEMDAVRNLRSLQEEAKKLNAFICVTNEFSRLNAFDGKVNVISYIPDDDSPETRAMLRHLLEDDSHIKPLHFTLITRNNSAIDKWMDLQGKQPLHRTLVKMGLDESYLHYLPRELHGATLQRYFPTEIKIVILHAYDENSIDFAQRMLPELMKGKGSKLSFFCFNNLANFVATATTKIFIYPLEVGVPKLANRISNFVIDQLASDNKNIHMFTEDVIENPLIMAKEIESFL